MKKIYLLLSSSKFVTALFPHFGPMPGLTLLWLVSTLLRCQPLTLFTDPGT